MFVLRMLLKLNIYSYHIRAIIVEIVRRCINVIVMSEMLLSNYPEIQVFHDCKTETIAVE